MIEEVQSSERVSVFKYPPVCVKCPASWIDEAVMFDQWALKDDAKYLRGWNAAKRIGKRAFAAYFDLQQQFLDNHFKWSDKRIYTDFSLRKDGQVVDIILNCIPIKDNKPKIGRNYLCNTWKSQAKRNNPAIHVFCGWWCPTVFMFGWIDNDDLKPGKQQIRENDLKPMYEHPMLRDLDTRGMYV